MQILTYLQHTWFHAKIVNGVCFFIILSIFLSSLIQASELANYILQMLYCKKDQRNERSFSLQSFIEGNYILKYHKTKKPFFFLCVAFTIKRLEYLMVHYSFLRNRNVMGNGLFWRRGSNVLDSQKCLGIRSCC